MAKLHSEVQEQSDRKRQMDSQMEDRIRYLEKLQGFENDRSTTEVCAMFGFVFAWVCSVAGLVVMLCIHLSL
mgnify:CR=1 FL=1